MAIAYGAEACLKEEILVAVVEQKNVEKEKKGRFDGGGAAAGKKHWARRGRLPARQETLRRNARKCWRPSVKV